MCLCISAFVKFVIKSLLLKKFLASSFPCSQSGLWQQQALAKYLNVEQRAHWLLMRKRTKSTAHVNILFRDISDWVKMYRPAPFRVSWQNFVFIIFDIWRSGKSLFKITLFPVSFTHSLSQELLKFIVRHLTWKLPEASVGAADEAVTSVYCVTREPCGCL